MGLRSMGNLGGRSQVVAYERSDQATIFCRRSLPWRLKRPMKRVPRLERILTKPWTWIVALVYSPFVVYLLVNNHFLVAQPAQNSEELVEGRLTSKFAKLAIAPIV